MDPVIRRSRNWTKYLEKSGEKILGQKWEHWLGSISDFWGLGPVTTILQDLRWSFVDWRVIISALFEWGKNNRQTKGLFKAERRDTKAGLQDLTHICTHNTFAPWRAMG